MMKSLISLCLLFLSANAFATRDINYWNGSGNSTRSENGVAWENASCANSVGLVVEKVTDQAGNPYLSIYGGLCYKESINVAFKVENGNLVLTSDSFGFSAPWTSNDVNKTVGQYDGKSFKYKFTVTAPDTKVNFIYEGSLKVASVDPDSATISISETVVPPSGSTTGVLVTGVVKNK
jgi:hypothetical protein